MRFHGVILVAVLGLTGCSDRQPSANTSRDIITKGTGIVDNISQGTIDGPPHIDIWSVKGTSLEAIAHLAVFEDFAPGLTFDEARRRYGEPEVTRTLENRTELRCYRRDTATLAVARELYFSSSPAAQCWTIRAFPKENGFTLDSFVSSNVLAQVPLPPAPYYLVLRDSTPSEQSLWLKVDSIGVNEVRWINSASWKQKN